MTNNTNSLYGTPHTKQSLLNFLAHTYYIGHAGSGSRLIGLAF